MTREWGQRGVQMRKTVAKKKVNKSQRAENPVSIHLKKAVDRETAS